MMANPRHGMWRHPLFVATLGRHIEEVVGSQQNVESPGIGGVGMEYLALRVLVKDTEARALLGWKIHRPEVVGTMDFPSEEGPGLSVFYKDAQGEIFHTYSTYARGLDILLTTYNFLDMTPKGRDEEGMTPHAMAWVRHHDRYAGGEAAACCSGEATKASKMTDPMLAEFQEE